MPVSTFTQPDYTNQLGSTYPTNIDSCVNVLAQIGQDFAPHAAATPNLTVLIDAGKIIKADGTLVSQNQQTATFVAPVTNPRIDRIVIDMPTGAYSIIAGTEAASPTAPAITAGKLPCAQVSLTVGITQITNALLTDERTAFANYDNRYLPSQAPEYAVAAGTDTYTATISPTPTAYVTGGEYHITFTNANTSATPTLNINGLGAVTIVKEGTAALVAGDIPAGHPALLRKTATQFVLLNPRYQSSTVSGVHAYRTAAQSIANGAGTPLIFDAESYDTLAFHDNVTNNTRVTVPAGVSYIKITAGATFDMNATGYRRLGILKNGAGILAPHTIVSIVPAASGLSTAIGLASPRLAVVAGDYFEIEATQNSGGALNIFNAWVDIEMTFH